MPHYKNFSKMVVAGDDVASSPAHGQAASLSTLSTLSTGAGHSARDRVSRVIVLSPALQRSRRPPGWGRGRKTGWGACGVPPGQAKKIGCNPGFFTGGRNQSRPRPVLVIPLP